MADAIGIHFLGSGSRGNATALQVGRQVVLIDCGFGPRVLAKRLASVGLELDQVQAVLLTHEHGDHSQGLRQLSRRPGIQLMLTAGTHRALRRQGLANWHSPPTLVRADESVAVAGLRVRAFRTLHDAAESVGYTVQLPDGRVLGLATDLGRVTAQTTRALEGVDILALESNHDHQLLRGGPYPARLKRRISSDRGHLSNASAAALVQQLAHPGLQQVVLIHLSATNNTPALARAATAQALQLAGHQPHLALVSQDRPLSLRRRAVQLGLFQPTELMRAGGGHRDAGDGKREVGDG